MHKTLSSISVKKKGRQGARREDRREGGGENQEMLSHKPGVVAHVST